MEIESIKPKLKQSEKAKKLGCSTSTLQRHRQDINKFAPFRIQPSSHERQQKTSNCEIDLERPQMTSIDLNWSQKNLL